MRKILTKADSARLNGGKDEIRTHETCYSLPAFQASAFNHSATFPHVCKVDLQVATITDRGRCFQEMILAVKTGPYCRSLPKTARNSSFARSSLCRSCDDRFLPARLM